MRGCLPCLMAACCLVAGSCRSAPKKPTAGMPPGPALYGRSHDAAARASEAPGQGAAELEERSGPESASGATDSPAQQPPTVLAGPDPNPAPAGPSQEIKAEPKIESASLPPADPGTPAKQPPASGGSSLPVPDLPATRGNASPAEGPAPFGFPRPREPRAETQAQPGSLHTPVLGEGVAHQRSSEGGVFPWKEIGASAGAAPDASAAALPVSVGRGSENPPRAEEVAQPLRVEPWLAADESAAKWREQQLAKHAAEERLRQEEQARLRGLLYKFLLRTDPAQTR
jgi:hypothetical protein